MANRPPLILSRLTQRRGIEPPRRAMTGWLLAGTKSLDARTSGSVPLPNREGTHDDTNDYHRHLSSWVFPRATL